jgi:hypothetical protein
MFFITSDPRENESFLDTESPQPANNQDANNWRGRCMRRLTNPNAKLYIACSTISIGSTISAFMLPLYLSKLDDTQSLVVTLGGLVGALAPMTIAMLVCRRDPNCR